LCSLTINKEAERLKEEKKKHAFMSFFQVCPLHFCPTGSTRQPKGKTSDTVKAAGVLSTQAPVPSRFEPFFVIKDMTLAPLRRRKQAPSANDIDVSMAAAVDVSTIGDLDVDSCWQVSAAFGDWRHNQKTARVPTSDDVIVINDEISTQMQPSSSPRRLYKLLQVCLSVKQYITVTSTTVPRRPPSSLLRHVRQEVQVRHRPPTLFVVLFSALII
jgi:hypothetical protein